EAVDGGRYHLGSDAVAGDDGDAVPVHDPVPFVTSLSDDRLDTLCTSTPCCSSMRRCSPVIWSSIMIRSMASQPQIFTIDEMTNLEESATSTTRSETSIRARLVIASNPFPQKAPRSPIPLAARKNVST